MKQIPIRCTSIINGHCRYYYQYYLLFCNKKNGQNEWIAFIVAVPDFFIIDSIDQDNMIEEGVKFITDQYTSTGPKLFTSFRNS